MIIIQEHLLQGIPMLEIVDHDQLDKKIPTVIFYHGWTNVKENVLINGYELAKNGIRAILPEALYHGERRDALPTEAHYGDFLKIVETSVTEFPVIIDFLVKAGKTDASKIGVSGLSMGGITTCCLMAKYDWIQCADCLMGTPYLGGFMKQLCEKTKAEGLEIPADWEAQIEKIQEIDLSLHPERINHRSFHFWHGKADDTVPYQPTYKFYEKEQQQSYGDHLTFTTTTGGHRVPVTITLEMANFFAHHLLK